MTYIDGYLKNNLDLAKQIIKKDWDMIFLIDGYEGSGKSVLAQQIAHYCDPTLNIDRIVFNPEDFKKAVKQAQPFQSIVYDEAFGGLNSLAIFDEVTRSLTQMLTVIRDRNLFIFVVMPSFFDMTKYIALWRSRALFHVYTGNNFERGFFAFYNQDRKKELYVNGKKFYDYKKGRPNFRGRFTNQYTVDLKEYKRKKRDTSISDATDTISTVKQIKTLIAKNLEKSSLKLKKEQTAQILGVTRMTLYRYLKEMDENPDKYPKLGLSNNMSNVTNTNTTYK